MQPQRRCGTCSSALPKRLSGTTEKAFPPHDKGSPACRKGLFGSMGGMRTRSGGGFMGEGNGVGGVARRSPAHRRRDGAATVL